VIHKTLLGLNSTPPDRSNTQGRPLLHKTLIGFRKPCNGAQVELLLCRTLRSHTGQATPPQTLRGHSAWLPQGSPLRKKVEVTLRKALLLTQSLLVRGLLSLLCKEDSPANPKPCRTNPETDAKPLSHAKQTLRRAGGWSQLFGHLDLAPTDVVLLFLLEGQMQKWERQQLARRVLLSRASSPPDATPPSSSTSTGSGPPPATFVAPVQISYFFLYKLIIFSRSGSGPPPAIFYAPVQIAHFYQHRLRSASRNFVCSCTHCSFFPAPA
jgi:hypothetical protein